MRIPVAEAAVANLRGRSTTALTLGAVLSILMGGVLTVAVPAFDARNAAASLYESPEWGSTHVVQGISGADRPMSGAEIQALADATGATSVQVDENALVEVAGGMVQMHSDMDVLGVPYVEGRRPREGSCEWGVHRDSPLADRLGEEVEATGLTGATASVVGVFPRGFPLFTPDDVVSTCTPPSPSGSEQILVTVPAGTELPEQYVSQTLAEQAQAARDASRSTGILGLITLVICVIAAGVAFACARWSVVSRRREFAHLQVHGAAKRRLLGMVTLEQILTCLAVAPVGIGLGWGGAWLLLSRAGQSGLVDPSVAWLTAAPSLSTVGLLVTGMLVVVVIASWLAAARILRPTVSTLLRRRGE